MILHTTILHTILLFIVGCQSPSASTTFTDVPAIEIEQPENTELTYDTSYKSIHIYVALCDNKYQGIVPVPAKIGDGQNPNSNLYWGCGYGIRTYFKKSAEWNLVQTLKPNSILMERLIFKHATKKYYLIADAYNGKYIKECTEQFLRSSGQQKATLTVNDTPIGIAGHSDLVAYIGHDGLMDFDITESFITADNKKRNTIILACYSKHFFSQKFKEANVNPLIWTTGLMCPEAYTIHDAISGYVNKETNEQIRTRAALAYSKYQKCSEKAARNLLVSGW
jgi:hypothetical protein